MPDVAPPIKRHALAAIRRDFDECWTAEGHTGWPHEGPERDHIRKMIDLRWPRPEPERDCFACTQVRRVTGYQRIGWLVSRTPPAPASSPDRDRKKIEARLAATEAEVQRLRMQLDDG